jgi:anthranilate/para-aminobenzoate synthase component I
MPGSDIVYCSTVRAPATRSIIFPISAPRRLKTIESKNGRVTVTNAEQQLSFDADAMDTVKERISAWGEARDTRYDLPPFQGGAAGFFGYDLARQMEHLPQRTEDSPSLPDMCIGLYDKIVSFDTTEKKAWIVIRAKHEGEAEKKRKLLSDLSFPRR